MATFETIVGEVEELRILGRDFFGSAKVRPGKGPAIAVVGKLLGVQPGDSVEVVGCWATHDKYGRQFKVRSMKTLVPRDASGVVAWLASRLPQLGPNRARALVEHLGVEGVWHVIENEPDRLLEVHGITPARRDEIVRAYHEHRAERDRIVRFKTWGLTDSQIAKVLDQWGDKAEKMLRENPFALIADVHGFGFARADAVAQRMGLAPDSPARIRAGLVDVMRQALEAGHCYVPRPALVSMASRLLGLPADPVWAELRKAGTEQRFVGVGKGDGIALPDIARAEASVASWVRSMVAQPLRKEAA